MAPAPRDRRTTPPRRRDPRRASRRTRENRILAVLCLIAVAGVAGVALSSRSGAPEATTASAGTTRPQAPAEAGPASEDQVAAPGASDVSLVAVGDTVMGTPEFGLPPANGSTLFDGVASLLVGDVVMGNLEEALATGPGSKCAGGSGGSCFAFASPPSYARNLRTAGFTIMGIANNHAYDWGPAGMRSTVRALDAAGILHTGRPGEIAVQTVRGGTKVAVIGLAPYSWSQNALDIPGAVALVRKAARMAPIVVVSMHVGAEGASYRNVPRGGETYLGEPRGEPRRLARSLVGAGADLIVGHGPHVMRGMEFRNGRLIAYSLGNFLGYKVFSTSGYAGLSGVLQVTLAPDGRFESGRIVPVRLSGNGVPSPGGSTATDVGRISRTDFGSSAARVSATGTITAP